MKDILKTLTAANKAEMVASVLPIYLLFIALGVTKNSCALVSLGTALANRVLPVLGGPYINMFYNA